MGSLRNMLKNAGHADSILNVQAPRSVLKTLFPEEETGKKARKARQAFADAVEHYELAVKCTSSSPIHRDILTLAKTHKSALDTLIKELIHQNLTGYYFLQRVEMNGSDLGYIALMREIRHVPRALAVEIANGLDAERYNQIISDDFSFAGRLVFDAGGFSMPVGQLTSPTLEHLMQNFSLLFSRIGVPDPDGEYIDRVWIRQPSVEGAQLE
jgi:hypothetical protein